MTRLLPLALLHSAILCTAPAEVITRFLDEVSLPTQGVITGGLTPHLDRYYFGSDDENDPGLWVTDGTPLGSWRINDEAVADVKISAPPYLFYWIGKDLYRTDGTPGQSTLIVTDWGTPPEYGSGLAGGLPGAAYWLDSVSGGWEIWRSLGQENDAALFADLPKGSAPSFAGLMVSNNEILVFFAPDPVSGTTALWAIDVTGSAPYVLDTGVSRDEPAFFCEDQIYYTKEVGGDLKLFRSGSQAGTAIQITSDEAVPYKNPAEFLVEGGSVYFQADDPDFGTELWSAHLDSPSARRLADLNSGGGNSSPVPLAVFKGDVWTMARVSGDTRLWLVPLDGVTEPARANWLPGSIREDYFHQAISNEEVIYLVSGPSLSSDQRWLSRSDGTTPGTEDLNTLWLNQTEAVAEGWPNIYPSQNSILFPSWQFATKTEVYTWKPTTDDPEVVKDANIKPLPGGLAVILQPTPSSQEIQYFTTTKNNKAELVRLRINGTRQVLRSGNSTDYGFDLTANLLTGTTFYRTNNDGLWSIRPGSLTPGLFYPVTTARSDLGYINLPFATTEAGILFLVTRVLVPNVGTRIYTSNGVNDAFLNTQQLFPDNSTPPRDYQYVPTLHKNRLYFVSSDLTFSRQPWYTTGFGNTQSFLPGVSFSSSVTILGSSDSILYITRPGDSLYAFNGSLSPYPTGAHAAVSPLVTPPATDEDGRFFYIGRDSRGEELWVTDGSINGGERLTDLQKSGETGAFADLTTIGDTLFFAARDEESGFELWMSDGSELGTVRLTDLRQGVDEDGKPYDSLPGTGGISLMEAFGEHVYFAADDGIHGMELWRVHESGSPVELVQDLVPGPGSSHPQNFTLLNDRLFFQAIDPARPLLALREIVPATPFDAKIDIQTIGSNIELRFGEGIDEPYLLMEGDSQLSNWMAVESFSGTELNQAQTLQYPLKEFGRYYRLQRN